MLTDLTYQEMAELIHPSQYQMNKSVLMFSSDKLRMDILQYAWTNQGLAQILTCFPNGPDFLITWILSNLPAALTEHDSAQICNEITHILDLIDRHLDISGQTRILSYDDFIEIAGRLMSRAIHEITLANQEFVRDMVGRSVYKCNRLSDSLYEVIYV